MADVPSHNDSVTIRNGTAGTARCLACGRAFVPRGRAHFCSAACRQAAWRQRQPARLPRLPTRAPRVATVYQCPVCDTRYLGAQWCPECRRFCRRLGPGGPCPHCDEPVAVSDLLPAAMPEKGGTSLSQ